jgi:hypothetical protein
MRRNSGARRAQLSCDMGAAAHRHATIVGTAGVTETESLNHTSDEAGVHLCSRVRVRRGTANREGWNWFAMPNR